MIKQRYISTLLNFNSIEILNDINEINLKYKKILFIHDKLNCIILKK